MDQMSERIRLLVQKILDQFGGEDVNFSEVSNEVLMALMERIMDECQLSFTTFIVEERKDG